MAEAGLNTTDLQYGEVEAMEQGRSRLNQPRQVPSAVPPMPQAPQAAPAQRMDVPDPVQFAIQRTGGNLTVPTQPTTKVDLGPWLPLVRKVATAKGASPLLKSAYLRMMDQANRQPYDAVAPQVVDVQRLDRAALEAFE